MVIKTTLPHSGWSYCNGDDQYENDSIGSTVNAKNLEKVASNLTKNDQKSYMKVIGSKNNEQHTNEQGWTRIDSNSDRKPKSMTNQHSTIDSIIASIDMDFNTRKNGALEANIDSPVRENICTIPDTRRRQTEIPFRMTTQQQRTLIPPTVEEVRKDDKKQLDPTTNNKKNRCKQRTEQEKQEQTDEERRSNKVLYDKNKNTIRNRGNIPSIRITNESKGINEFGITKMATNEQSNDIQIDTNTRTTGNKNDGNDGNKKNETNNPNKKNNNTNQNEEHYNDDNNNGSNRQRVNIKTPGDMETYSFTISWRPDQKAGQDGKIIIRMLMREMAHRTPSIIFHPTNSASSPVPRDINNINNDFPKTPASFDDFFDQMRNREHTNQRTFMKVTMPHDEKELQRKLNNYLFHNKLYMNSPFIDDNTLEQVGFIENGHSRLVYRPNLEIKIKNGLKEVMEGDQLTPQQIAQLKHLSSTIRVECQRGTVRAGPIQNQVVCEGIVLKTAKSQSKIAMELLSMLPDNILGEHYRIIPKSLNSLLGYELYGRILSDTVNFQNNLRPITIMYCHPSVFEDMYDSVKLETSLAVKVSKFMKDCCGAISIEETNETRGKGKYIVVVPEEKVETARIAIGKMFQDFQHSGGRPAATACLSAYQNYPLVNDNVTISGHAERLSEKIRDRYRNRPKTHNNNHNSSASYSYHGSTTPGSHDKRSPQEHTPTVPRSILQKGKSTNNTPTSPWRTSPVVQQQQRPTTNQHVEERTIMSNLSPDDSAKTMMTNVSRMVESLGSVVQTLVKETSNTNSTLKEMMMHQTNTMNNFMMMMATKEARREEVPISITHHQPSPNSTITNSQHTLSQQSTNANKRIRMGGTADDETTAASTAIQEQMNTEYDDDDIDKMLEDHEEAIKELTAEQQTNNNNNESINVDMADNDQIETVQQQQHTITTNKTTTALAAGNFEHQFSTKSKNVDTSDPPPGVNPNRQ